MNSRLRGRRSVQAWLFGLGVFGVGAAVSAQSIATVGELLAGVLGQSESPSSYFVIPVAGHVEGAQGTEFRTDVTILAAGPEARKVAVAWLAQGIDNSAQPLDFFEVGAAPAFFPDMAAITLGKSGLGALVVAAVTPDGSLDPAASLSGFARVWTPITGCPGSSSIAVEPNRFGANIGYPMGLRLDRRHRGTLGLVNPNAEPRVFTVYFADPPTEIAVPPASMRQVPIPERTHDQPVPLAVSGNGRKFAGYATSIDQRSGDGWLISFNPR